MDHLVLLIKPASSLCNLRCSYCFYHSVAGQRECYSLGLMSEATAENIIVKALEYANKTVTFSFQGGEPTLAGLEFFKSFVDMVRKHNSKKLQIQYTIQTNGVLLDDAFVGFLKETRFLTGVSLDGTKDIHDFLRHDANGKGTYGAVSSALSRLKAAGAEYNILCVVSRYVAAHIGKVYNALKKGGHKYLQFIPCLDPLSEKPFSSEYSTPPALFGSFLKTLFKLWYDDYMAGRYISIRTFDNLINIAAGYPPEMCSMNGYCMGQFVIEGDGSVFPCDFYCVDNWKTGNINTMTFEEIRESDKMKQFIETSYFNDPKCQNCDVYAFCRGGCRRDRDSLLDGRAGENIYCEALHEFNTYAIPYIRNIHNSRYSKRR